MVGLIIARVTSSCECVFEYSSLIQSNYTNMYKELALYPNHTSS